MVGLIDKGHMQGKLPIVFAVCRDEYKGREETIVSELEALCLEKLTEYSQPEGIDLLRVCRLLLLVRLIIEHWRRCWK